MRTVSLLAAAAVVGIAACAQPAMQVDTGAIDVPSWSATIQRIDNADSLDAPIGIAGSLVVRPGSNPTMTTATIMLSNANPNSTHPWHIHAGGCGSESGIVGPPNAYTPLTTDAQGSAEATVTLPFSTPTAGNFSVNVHKSPNELGTIIACGPLTLGTSPMR